MPDRVAARPDPVPVRPRAGRARAARSSRCSQAGLHRRAGNGAPPRDPATMELLFDSLRRGVDLRHAPAGPLTLQWDFPDAEPWHLRVDNGEHVGRGRASPSGPTSRTSVRYDDFVDVFAGRLDPRRAMLDRPDAPARLGPGAVGDASPVRLVRRQADQLGSTASATPRRCYGCEPSPSPPLRCLAASSSSPPRASRTATTGSTRVARGLRGDARQRTGDRVARTGLEDDDVRGSSTARSLFSMASTPPVAVGRRQEAQAVDRHRRAQRPPGRHPRATCASSPRATAIAAAGRTRASPPPPQPASRRPRPSPAPCPARLPSRPLPTRRRWSRATRRRAPFPRRASPSSPRSRRASSGSACPGTRGLRRAHRRRLGAGRQRRRRPQRHARAHRGAVRRRRAGGDVPRRPLQGPPVGRGRRPHRPASARRLRRLPQDRRRGSNGGIGRPHGAEARAAAAGARTAAAASAPTDATASRPCAEPRGA